ncbi:MAG: LuxR C-terminal-related transcriptional regulator [Paramuribaculum sp.]|nr:LuxR C-terminal-related transcriptional regulator [Paramuribaculum sp.]
MIDKQRGYLPTNTMRELIRDNAMLLPAISRFDIAFGFGDSPVATVCRDSGVDTDTFLSVCNLLSGYPFSSDSISLHSLMGYLKHAHTSFLDVAFPKIRHHLIDAINTGGADEVSLLLMKFYDDYVAEVKRHMDHENDVIFQYVERLLAHEINEDFSISAYSVNHGHMAEKLNELKDIFIYHYKQKENTRLSAVLFDIIICERDMMSHFDVENRLFIPAVERLESNLRSLLRTPSGFAGEEGDEADSQLSVLSEREKDIIRAVACGKANKEIADQLCISVHTVATHRRNISTKLGIHTSAGLVIFAIINHLVDVNDVKPI